MRTTRKIRTAMAGAVAGLCIPSSGWREAAGPAVPTPQPVATGVWLISGGILPNHEPDGNSVLLDAPAGLIVVDTGRHDWDARAILALARERQHDIIAIVNSHRDLHHVSSIAALGDLVTLPAPFLDTACPEGWKSALAEVSATPFRIAIPGHGAPMQRSQFLLYRRSFESFIACSRSDRPRESCAADWSQAVRPLLSADPLEMRRARSMSVYYVELLRANGGRGEDWHAGARPQKERRGGARV